MADNFNQMPPMPPQGNPADVQNAVNAAMEEQKKKKRKKRLIILAVIAVIIIGGIALGSSSKDDKTAQPTTAASVSAQNENETEKETQAAEAQEQVEGKIGDFICTVKSAKLCKNWEGKDSVLITYSFTNNSKEAQSFDVALSDDVYQDGVGLEDSFISSDDDDFGLDVKIKPGTTKEVKKVYILNDTKTQLEIEISELISFSDEKITTNVEISK